MPYKASKKFPHFADLKGILTQSKNTDNALYQTVQEVIERLGVMKILTEENLVAINDQINTIIGAIGSIPPPVAGMNLDYLGDFVSGPIYNDGDIVVGADGVLYMCVVDGTTTPPEPFPTTPPALHGTTHVPAGTDPIPNAAYRNIDNNFVAQTLATNSAIVGANSVLTFVANSAPADKKIFRLLNYGDGLFRIELLNDAQSIVLKSFNFSFNGSLAISGAYLERARSVAMGEWTTYSPTWTSTGVAPAIGNGILTGKYTLIGKTAFVTISFQVGSTTTLGSGVWIFGLPVTANVAISPNGSSVALSDSGLAFLASLIYFADGVRVLIQYNGAAQVGPTVPFTWATGDSFNFTATYEIL